MKSRLPDLPVLRSITSQVDALHYNRIRLALARLECPLRLVLPGLRGLDMVIDRQEWICIDRTLNDLPVLAWTDFDSTGRVGLHTPVRCRLLFFHAYANVIIRTALDDITRILAQRLGKPVESGPAKPVTSLLQYRQRR